MRTYSDSERKELTEMICALYESQNATIESCCEACGVPERTFRLWLSQNAEDAERYKKAKEVQDHNYWHEIIKPKAKTALQRHLEVEYAEREVDVVYQGVLSKDEEGNPVKQRTREFVLPNPTITIFSMKGLYPGMFADKHEHSGPGGGAIEIGLSAPAQADIKNLLDKINGASEPA